MPDERPDRHIPISTDEELDAECIVTQDDVEKALAAWDDTADEFTGLLGAEPAAADRGAK